MRTPPGGEPVSGRGPERGGPGRLHAAPLSSLVDGPVTSSAAESSALSEKRFALQGFAALRGQKGKRPPPQTHAPDVSLTAAAWLSSIVRCSFVRRPGRGGCAIVTTRRRSEPLPTDPLSSLALVCVSHTRPEASRRVLLFEKAEADFSGKPRSETGLAICFSWWISSRAPCLILLCPAQGWRRGPPRALTSAQAT